MSHPFDFDETLMPKKKPPTQLSTTANKTSTDVARLITQRIKPLSINSDGVARIARKHSIGLKINARVTLYSDADIEQIRQHVRGKVGHPRNESEK